MNEKKIGTKNEYKNEIDDEIEGGIQGGWSYKIKNISQL